MKEESGQRGIPKADLDDVVGVIAELQAARTQPETIRPEEVGRVAAELDLDPALVGQAVLELARRREVAAAAERAAEVSARERRATLRRRAGLGMVAAVLLGVVGGLLPTWSAGARLAAARGEEAAAGQALSVVIDRQASLVPQIAGLAGADTTTLESQVAAVRSASELSARRAAAATLADGLAHTLSSLPPPATDAETQLRLNLSYEVTGTQNRITTEARRYEEAHAARVATESGFYPAIASRLGMAGAATVSP